ncbi:ORF6N domain-containing protein [Escherichia coli]
MPVIEWQEVSVVTTETLAAGYGTTPIRIQQNYIRNEERFVEGKHFFKISGDELKSFRLSLASRLINIQHHLSSGQNAALPACQKSSIQTEPGRSSKNGAGVFS